MFALTKILTLLLQPILWVIFLLLAGWFFRKKKWGKRCFLSGFIVLIVFSNPLLFHFVASVHEGEITSIDDIRGNYDYVILLGGFSNMGTEEDDPYTLNEQGSRLTSALGIYKSGKARKLIISGGSGNPWIKEQKEAIVLKKYLVERLGFPEDEILIEPNSKNTKENAIFTKQLLADLGENNPSCILVTSASHMPRAKGLFIKAGLEVTPYPTSFLTKKNRGGLKGHVIPSAKIMEHWYVLFKEWVGYGVYRLKGDI